MRKLNKNHVAVENSIHAYRCNCDCSAVAGCRCTSGNCHPSIAPHSSVNNDNAVHNSNAMQASSSTGQSIASW